MKTVLYSVVKFDLKKDLTKVQTELNKETITNIQRQINEYYEQAIISLLAAGENVDNTKLTSEHFDLTYDYRHTDKFIATNFTR